MDFSNIDCLSLEWWNKMRTKFSYLFQAAPKYKGIAHIFVE